MVDLNRHLYGSPGAPHTVLEYGDFQCPYCRAAAPVLRALVDASDGAAKLTFRHFPLFQKHPFALTAALAAEAAGDQFWAMHDLLFAHQDQLDDAHLAEYGTSLGLREVVGEAVQDFRPAVEADYRAGVADGARGTPTLFLDGSHYGGQVHLAALRTELGLPDGL